MEMKAAKAPKPEIDAAVVELLRLKKLCGEVAPPKKKWMIKDIKWVNTDCIEKNKIFAVNINTNVHIKLDKAISNRFNKLVIHFLIFFLFVISSQRHIVVSSVNFWCFLAFHNSESVGDSGSGFIRSDNVVNETTFGSL